MLTLIKKVIQSMGKPSRSFIARVGIAVLGMGLVACGDDNKLAGGDPNNSIIDGSGLAPVVGSIDGFGSIIIDGIRYNTDEAKIFAQGQVSAESNLAVGDYVTLFVRTDAEDRVLESGDVVDMVFYEAPVIGAITAIDLSDNALAIANQIIRLSSNTLFDSNLGARSLSDLALGDRVEVSGPSNNEGDIIATRIYAARQTQDVLSGLVFDQDETNQSFRLQGVVIDYSNAAVVNNFDNGDAVSVTGAFNPATQQIVATSVRLRDDRITPKELESVPFIIFGLVEGYELGDTFEVSGYSVKLAPETRFVGGNIDALQNNQLITVVGSLDSDGVVQAATIELDTSSDLDLFTDPDFENEDISDEVDEPLDTPSELDDSNESNDPPVEEDSIDQEIEVSNAEEEAINGDNIETEIVETEIVETEIVESETVESETSEYENEGTVLSLFRAEEGAEIGAGDFIETPFTTLEWSKNSIVIISEKTLFYTASDPLILDENLENEPTILPPSGQLTPDQLADVVRIVEEVAADETLPFDEDSSDAGQRFYTNIDALQQGTKIRVEGYSQNDYFIALAIEIRL